jgi:hypothetical protein
MSSLGKIAQCKKLMCEELGSESQPISTIHMASNFQLQNHLAFKEGNATRLLIQKNGHLAVSQDVHLYDSADISTGTLKYSLGLSADGTKFQIVNEQTNSVVFEADDTGSIALETVTGLVDALNSKQTQLNVAGQPVSTNVLNVFQIASQGDGNPANSLVTAKAIEDWFEALQASLVQVQPGQAGPSFRQGFINVTSPSTVNVPSCFAVSVFVDSKIGAAMRWQIDPFDNEAMMPIGSPISGGTFQIKRVYLPLVDFQLSPPTDAVKSFRRFKTTSDELLGDNENAPMSCQSYLESGTNAVFAQTHSSGYHKLSPSGKKIDDHLTQYYATLSALTASIVRVTTLEAQVAALQAVVFSQDNLNLASQFSALQTRVETLESQVAGLQAGSSGSSSGGSSGNSSSSSFTLITTFTAANVNGMINPWDGTTTGTNPPSLAVANQTISSLSSTTTGTDMEIKLEVIDTSNTVVLLRFYKGWHLGGNLGAFDFVNTGTGSSHNVEVKSTESASYTALSNKTITHGNQHWDWSFSDDNDFDNETWAFLLYLQNGVGYVYSNGLLGYMDPNSSSATISQIKIYAKVV